MDAEMIEDFVLESFGQGWDRDPVVTAPAAGGFQEQKLRCNFNHPMKIGFWPIASDKADHTGKSQGKGIAFIAFWDACTDNLNSTSCR